MGRLSRFFPVRPRPSSRLTWPFQDRGWQALFHLAKHDAGIVAPETKAIGHRHSDVGLAGL